MFLHLLEKHSLRKIIIYTGISLLILWILLLPGYILTFDMAWGPVAINGSSLGNTILLNQLFVLLSSFIPNWVIQKAILFLIFFLSGLGAHKFAALKNNTFAYFAGFLYIFNPFVYTRLMAGQWMVLLGYAFLPWAVRSVYLFFQNADGKNAFKVIFWSALICLTSIHTIGILFLISLILLISVKRENLRRLILKSILILAALMVINAFWIIPILQGNSSTAKYIQSFGENELVAFQTSGTVLNSPTISALLLSGFWADGQNRYILPLAQPIWWIGALGIIVLVVIGLYKIIKNKSDDKYSRLGIALIIGGFISLILGLGIALDLTKPLILFLDKIIPLYSGYREPQKWLMLLSLLYSFAGSIGAYQVIEFLKQRNKESFYSKIFLLIIPILFAPILPFAAAWQLKSVD